MNTYHRKNQGFSLIELLIVLVILTILISIAVPEVENAVTTGRASRCGAALRQIETAKSRWRKEYPGGRDPTEAELANYFADSTLPEDPWGIGFNYVTNLSRAATHNYNNNSKYEPKGNCNSANGYNDVDQPTGM